MAGPFVGALLVGGLSFWLGGGVIGGQTTLVMGLGLMLLVLFVDGGVIGAVTSLFAKGNRLRALGTETEGEHRHPSLAALKHIARQDSDGSLEARAIVRRFGGITPVNGVSLTSSGGGFIA